MLLLGVIRRVVGRSLQYCNSSVEWEDSLPVVLHADDGPSLCFDIVVERLGKRSDLARGQSLGRAIGIFARRVVVLHQHHQGALAARSRVFQHLAIACRVAERGLRRASGEQVDVLRLAREIIVEQQHRQWTPYKHSASPRISARKGWCPCGTRPSPTGTAFLSRLRRSSRTRTYFCRSSLRLPAGEAGLNLSPLVLHREDNDLA